MKKTVLVSLFALCFALLAAAQTTSEEYLAKYNRQVARLGYAGVGVEGILDKWEAAFPEDGTMLEARSNYCLAKGMSSEVVIKNQRKFMGNDPVLALPDSTGSNVNFFEEQFFDDDLFGAALGYIEKANSLYPYEMRYRIDKVNMLLAYEKEYPDMVKTELSHMVDMNASKKCEWTYDGAPLTDADFIQVMSEYCVKLYSISSDASFEAFRLISSRMNKAYPKETVFIDNLGSYQFMFCKNESKALKYYKKALKIDPEDTVAARNIQIIERRRAQAKANKKK